ncbi:hypothetical protein HDV63DRAFT_413759 [Trichoderma sp. SZMC 28014]
MASSRNILDPAAYTVAWFAPLEIEARAALHLLDNRHNGSFRMGPGNDYVFQAGDACGHNIIIATLPAGQNYGTGSAAALATQVKSFFPNLWFGLLVGVAAGLPNLSLDPPLDIRLGDVLVNLSTSNSAGVIAYDLRKVTDKDGFELLHHGYALANTATVVRSAIGNIKLQQPNDANLILPYYKSIQDKEHSSGTFGDPGQDKDMFYQFDQDGVERLIQRDHRPDDKRVRVWYGTIGSGEKLLKNARERDKLRDKYGFIGLEMEAAGTMDCIPVGVIRGVCDYGDKHKNKDWQPYAAAMAAAYAKAILAKITPNDGKQAILAEITNDRKRHSAEPRAAVEDTPEPAINNSRVIDDATKQSLIDQLYFDKIDERVTHLTAAQRGTCGWFLTKPEYKSWHDMAQQLDHGGLLWIKGNPGTGKSTLMKFLFEEAKMSSNEASPQIILSFFFLARGTDDEKSTTGLYRSLLHQLFQKIPETKDSLEWMTADGAKTVQRNRWQDASLKQTLGHAVQKLGCRSLTIFVDALDECNQDQVTDMISFFEELCDGTNKRQLSLRVCFSSRHYPTVTIQQGIEVILEEESGHTDDIKQYIKSKLRVPKSNKTDSLRYDSLRQEILTKSSGIFLWVVLVLDILNQECSKSIKKMRDRLKEIPPRLNDLFQMILTRDGDNRDQLKACLKWILFASRPLKPPELYFAVQFNIDKECSGLWDREDIGLDEMKAFVRSSSKGLAEVTRNRTSEVQFIHESIRDFLLGSYSEEWSEDRSNLSGYSHDSLKDCCVAQLMGQDAYLHLTTPESVSEEAGGSIHSQFPFLKYAILNIFYHSNVAQKLGIEQKGFLNNFPLPRWISFNNAFEMYAIRRYKGSAKMLYILSEKNMVDLIGVYPEKDYFEVGYERYGTPIFAALANNSREVVKAFLRSQAETIPRESVFHDLYETYCQHENTKANLGRDYTFKRNRSILYNLLKGVDEIFLVAYLHLSSVKRGSNLDDDRRITPFCRLAEKGFAAAIKTIVTYHHVDIDICNEYGMTSLMLAARHGDINAVKLLLTNNANINAPVASSGDTPLTLAALRGHENVVKVLLKNNANVDARNFNGKTALICATHLGYHNVIKLLLDNKANIELADRAGHTPLFYAQKSGVGRVIELLQPKETS